MGIEEWRASVANSQEQQNYTTKIRVMLKEVNTIIITVNMSFVEFYRRMIENEQHSEWMCLRGDDGKSIVRMDDIRRIDCLSEERQEASPAAPPTA